MDLWAPPKSNQEDRGESPRAQRQPCDAGILVVEIINARHCLGLGAVEFRFS